MKGNIIEQVMSLSESSGEYYFTGQMKAKLSQQPQQSSQQLKEQQLKVSSQNTESTNEIVFESKKYGGDFAVKNQNKSLKVLYSEMSQIDLENRSMSFEEKK